MITVNNWEIPQKLDPYNPSGIGWAERIEAFMTKYATVINSATGKFTVSATSPSSDFFQIIGSDNTVIAVFDTSANSFRLTGTSASKIMVTDSFGNVKTSPVDASQLGYISAVSADIQNQINSMVTSESLSAYIPQSTSGTFSLSGHNHNGTYLLTTTSASFASSAHNHSQGDVISSAGWITDALNARELSANKGQPNGYAGLDGTGRVPSAQLPSYVDEVVEYASLSAFPITGISGIIYIAIDTNFTYRWSGSVYVRLNNPALPVTSVAGRAGDVVLSASDITDINKYYTSAQTESVLTAYSLSGHNHNGTYIAITSAGAFATSSHGHSWVHVSATPTTLSGYGITDALQASTSANYIPVTSAGAFATSAHGHDGVYLSVNTSASFASSAHGHAWSQVSATPTTLTGYGITDAQPTSAMGLYALASTSANYATSGHNHSGVYLPIESSATIATSAHTQDWPTITETPTTLSGYGITDAQHSITAPLGEIVVGDFVGVGSSPNFKVVQSFSFLSGEWSKLLIIKSDSENGADITSKYIKGYDASGNIQWRINTPLTDANTRSTFEMKDGSGSQSTLTTDTSSGFAISGPVSIPTGKTYNINGSPHNHDGRYALASTSANYATSGHNHSGVYLPVESSATFATSASLGLYALASTSADYITITSATAFATSAHSHAMGSLTAAGTSGFIPFSDGTTLINTSAFNWDNVNNRLGIGTATPSNTLHVVGGITAGALTLSDYIYSVYQNDTAYATSSSSVSYPDCGYKALFENTSKANNSAALTLYHVRRGSFGTDAYAYFGVEAGTVPYRPNFVWGNSTNDPAYIETMRLDGEGRLGIGTATPGSVIDIQKNSAAAETIRIQNNNAGGTSLVQVGNNVGDALNVINYGSTRTGKLFGSVGTDRAGNQYIQSYKHLAIGTPYGYDIIFGTNDAERTRITSAGVVHLQSDLHLKANGDILLWDGNNSNYIGFSVPTDVTGSYAITFPAAQGAAGTTLQNDSNGNMSWVQNKPTLSKTLVIESPTASENITVFRTNVAITLQAINAVITGSTSCTYQVRYSATDRSGAGTSAMSATACTNTTTGAAATITSASVPANSWVWVVTTASSGPPTSIAIDIRYTED
jgi:hypothetical protein